MSHPRLKSSLQRVLPIAALMLVVMFKFQNCAPQSNMYDASSIGDGGEVRIVDRWAEQKVSFINPTHTVDGENAAVDIQGLCVGSDKGQQIRYQIIEIADVPHVVYEGLVECLMGGFELKLPAVHFASCSTRYQVRAARIGEETDYAETVLQPNCN